MSTLRSSLSLAIAALALSLGACAHNPTFWGSSPAPAAPADAFWGASNARAEQPAEPTFWSQVPTPAGHTETTHWGLAPQPRMPVATLSGAPVTAAR